MYRVMLTQPSASFIIINLFSPSVSQLFAGSREHLIYSFSLRLLQHARIHLYV